MMLWFQWDERRLEIAGVGCTPVPFSPFFWPPSTCKFYTFKFNPFFFSHTNLLFFSQQIWTVTMEDLINNFTVTYRETLALGGECPVSVTLTLALRLTLTPTSPLSLGAACKKVEGLLGICSTSVLLQQHVKDPGHSAKSAGGRLQLNMHAPYIICMWLCMKWHGAWLYGVHRTRQDGSSFMWHQPCQHCKYTTLVDSQKRAIKSYSLM